MHGSETAEVGEQNFNAFSHRLTFYTVAELNETWKWSLGHNMPMDHPTGEGLHFLDRLLLRFWGPKIQSLSEERGLEQTQQESNFLLWVGLI